MNELKSIPQCKGKALDKVVKSKLLDRNFVLAKKYDGNYVQIHKTGDEVAFFTSGGKYFRLLALEEAITNAFPYTDFILEAEYMYACEGKLGDRKYSSRLTTYRTDTAKGNYHTGEVMLDVFRVFDVLYLAEHDEVKYSCYKHSTSTLARHKVMSAHLTANKLRHTGLHLVKWLAPRSLSNCIKITKGWINDGWEGGVAKHISHTQRPGKRVNELIKLKYRKTADLLCTGVNPGEGKYEGMIGSLVLVDNDGIVVNVGSGMTDADRQGLHSYYIGKKVEISYERIQDTYIQPTFVAVRTEGNT